MLNERREYEFYLTEGYGGIYKRDNIKNNLAGLRPILICLARGFLDELDVTELAQKDALTQEFLSCWLTGKYEASQGLDEEIIEKFERAKKCCLLDHIVNGDMKIRCLKNTLRKTVSEYLENKVDSWKKSMFYSYGDNSVNEIYFKAIIADALQKGELKNNVLVIKNKHDNYGIDTTPEGLQNINNLFAVVATCLQNLPKGQTSTTVKVAQLSNILNKPANRKKNRDSLLSAVEGYTNSDIYTYKGKPLVSKDEIAGGVVKLALNSDWIKDYDVRLIENDETIDSDYSLFTDEKLLPSLLGRNL